VASGETAEGQPGAAKKPKADESYVGVLGAGGEVDTLRRAESVEDGRQDRLVDAVGDADGESGFGIGHCAYLLDDLAWDAALFLLFFGGLLNSAKDIGYFAIQGGELEINHGAAWMKDYVDRNA
jgi:hypothetical protein